MTAIYCSTTDKIPKKLHYAIIGNTSTHIPGDQRSIDCPGHGYPASTEYNVTYVAYLDKDEWAKEINKRMTSTYSSDKNFVAVKVEPAKIEISTLVNIS
jgi:hypothetical protein